MPLAVSLGKYDPSYPASKPLGMHAELIHIIALKYPDLTSFPFSYSRHGSKNGLREWNVFRGYLVYFVACSTKRRTRLNRKT